MRNFLKNRRKKNTASVIYANFSRIYSLKKNPLRKRNRLAPEWTLLFLQCNLGGKESFLANFGFRRESNSGQWSEVQLLLHRNPPESLLKQVCTRSGWRADSASGRRCQCSLPPGICSSCTCVLIALPVTLVILTRMAKRSARGASETQSPNSLGSWEGLPKSSSPPLEGVEQELEKPRNLLKPTLITFLVEDRPIWS